MRRDHPTIQNQTDQDEAVGFTFYFQIANGANRKACRVRVEAFDFFVAQDAFRQNWPAIERMARQSLASAGEGAEINLTLPSPAPG